MTKRIWTVAVLLMLAAMTIAQQTGIVRKIDVQGNKEVTTQAILATMRTKVGQPYLQSNLDADKKALEDLGFFQSVDVRAKAVENNDWEVVVEVLEWPVVKEIRVVGNNVIKTEDILKQITVEPGKIFNLRDQVASSRRIEDLYSKRNYFARVEEFGPLRDSPGTINVVVRELTIGTVSVQGNFRTKTKVIGRLIKSKSGQPYDRHKWEMDLRRIYGTQWFENVKSIETQDENDPYKINLLADVKETRTGQFNIGLQVDPRSSFAGVLKLQDANFRGTGQAVGIDFLQATSGGGPSIGLDYSNPFIDNHDTALRASIYSRLLYRFSSSTFGGSNDVPTDDGRYTERRTGGSIGFSRPVSEISSFGINTRLEQIRTNNLTTTNLNGFIKQDGEVGVLTFGFTRNRRDVDIDPSRGDFLRVQLEPGIANITDIGGAVLDPTVLGRHSFMKFSVDFRKYFTNQPPRGRELDAPRRVLATRLFYGTISGKTPFFEQYFAGGSETVRGYPEDRFWGNQTLFGTAELRIPVQKAFSMIGFVDYGGAWGGYGGVNEFTQSNKLKLHLGYGIGFSFRTPLGPLRLDLGFDERGKSRTHFLIGTSF